MVEATFHHTVVEKGGREGGEGGESTTSLDAHRGWREGGKTTTLLRYSSHYF
jgi:hypothetical protein